MSFILIFASDRNIAMPSVSYMHIFNLNMQVKHTPFPYACIMWTYHNKSIAGRVSVLMFLPS